MKKIQITGKNDQHVILQKLTPCLYSRDNQTLGNTV